MTWIVLRNIKHEALMPAGFRWAYWIFQCIHLLPLSASTSPSSVFRWPLYRLSATMKSRTWKNLINRPSQCCTAKSPFFSQSIFDQQKRQGKSGLVQKHNFVGSLFTARILSAFQQLIEINEKFAEIINFSVTRIMAFDFGCK